MYDVEASPSSAGETQTRQPLEEDGGQQAPVPNEKWWAKQMDELEDVPEDVQAELSAVRIDCAYASFVARLGSAAGFKQLPRVHASSLEPTPSMPLICPSL